MKLNLVESPIKIGNAEVVHIDNVNCDVAICVHLKCNHEQATDHDHIRSVSNQTIKFTMDYLTTEGFLTMKGHYNVHISIVATPNQ